MNRVLTPPFQAFTIRPKCSATDEYKVSWETRRPKSETATISLSSIEVISITAKFLKGITLLRNIFTSIKVTILPWYLCISLWRYWSNTFFPLLKKHLHLDKGNHSSIVPMHWPLELLKCCSFLTIDSFKFSPENSHLQNTEFIYIPQLCWKHTTYVCGSTEVLHDFFLCIPVFRNETIGFYWIWSPNWPSLSCIFLTTTSSL